MNIPVGDFNLNNLFSRFSLYTEADPQIRSEEAEEATEEKPRVWLTSPEGEKSPRGGLEGHLSRRDRCRQGAGLAARFKGKLSYAKEPEAQETLAERIEALAVDVFCVQEVEDLAALEDFVKYLDLETPASSTSSLVEG